MKNTANLLLKNLIQRLHPPSTPTPRESARLLALLDKSFRQQLDEAHPPPITRHNAVAPVPISLNASQAANTHLDSVLSHPLLETTPAHTTSQSPIDVFDASIRASTLTLSKLQTIAQQYLVDLRSTTATHVPAQSKLGPKISAWFGSENIDTKIALFKFPSLLRDVVSIMYADGLESIVWTWLRSLYQRDWVPHLDRLPSDDTSAFLQLEDRLISEMMRMSIQRKSLQDAAAQYIQAATYRFGSEESYAPPKTSGLVKLRPPLLACYRRLSFSILHLRKSHGIDASTFDQLLKYPVPFDYDPTISLSILKLYHPTQPKASPLYIDFQDEAFVQDWNAWHAQHPRLHSALLTAVFDAARIALKHEDLVQARFFRDFATKYWPEHNFPHSLNVSNKVVDCVEAAELELEHPTTFSLSPT